MELESVKMEAFAQALARGLPPRRAASAGGYARDGKGRAKDRAARPDVKARVAEIAREREEVACDPQPLIAELIRLAGVAGQLGTEVGLREARVMLAEVAKMKAVARAELERRRRDEDDKAWAAKYGAL